MNKLATYTAMSLLSVVLISCVGVEPPDAALPPLEERVKGEESGMTYLVQIPRPLADDETIAADARELIAETERSLSGLETGDTFHLDELPPIRIEWLRKGRTVTTDAEQPEPGELETKFDDDVDGLRVHGRDDDPIDSFSAYKPTTRNEFDFYIPPRLRQLVQRRAEEAGETESYSGPDGAKARESAEGIEEPSYVPLGWSLNDDNRTRLGSLNTRIDFWPWRTITHFSNGCSGTLIGPRHIVTAAHCINDKGTNDFKAFTVRTRRNGSAFLDRSDMPGCPDFNCPNTGSSYWYFTPSQWRRASVSDREQYDFGIIVTPDRLGDASGWLGRWYASMGALNTVNKYSRGYPCCDSRSSAGEERIDDPADSSACNSCTTDLTTCSSNHLYGDASTCSVANGENVDGDGYNRNFRMTCDGSACMSGSPLYFYGDGNVGASGSVYYTAHDIGSMCGHTESAPSCADVSRCDRLLRLTPQYASWISWFRSQFP